VSEPLFHYLKDTVLHSFGTDTIYGGVRNHGWTSFSGLQGSKASLKWQWKEGIHPPFGDVGPRRQVGWEQLGIRWFVEWEIEYETAQVAESFCATLQILLADLRMWSSLFSQRMSHGSSLHDSGSKFWMVSDNKRTCWQYGFRGRWMKVPGRRIRPASFKALLRVP